jgi:hypothetical protein
MINGLVGTAALDLYWIPVGAGNRVVRSCTRTAEAVAALMHRRRRTELFHAALIATVDSDRITIEMTPVPDSNGVSERGVVAEGPVGSRLLSRFRVFRYEIRRWSGGHIPDLRFAVASPVRLSEDPAAVRRALVALESVPVLVWGRDEIGLGEMWNSNSVVAWVLASCGLTVTAGRPPTGGRAPGWDAGAVAAVYENPGKVPVELMTFGPRHGTSAAAHSERRMEE